jgi:hypothetical protein
MEASHPSCDLRSQPCGSGVSIWGELECLQRLLLGGLLSRTLLRQLLSVAVLSIIMALPLAVNAAISDIDKAAKQNFKAAKQEFKEAKQEFKAAKQEFKQAKQNFKIARQESRTAVPIPSTLLLFGAGFAAFVGWREKDKDCRACLLRPASSTGYVTAYASAAQFLLLGVVARWNMMYVWRQYMAALIKKRFAAGKALLPW